jgi:hypothetical protein
MKDINVASLLSPQRTKGIWQTIKLNPSNPEIKKMSAVGLEFSFCPLVYVLCCETAGFSWVFGMNMFEWISLNECISDAGHGIYTWQCETRHRQRKWRQDLLTGWNCLNVIFLMRDVTMLMTLTSRLAYIYSIFQFDKERHYFHTICSWWRPRKQKTVGSALAAWHSSHCVRQQNRRIPGSNPASVESF